MSDVSKVEESADWESWTVLLFAGLKAEFGASVTVPRPRASPAVTAAALLTAVEETLRAKLPPPRRAAFTVRGCLLSVDLVVYSPEDTDCLTLRRDSEIAVLPPVSGG